MASITKPTFAICLLSIALGACAAGAGGSDDDDDDEVDAKRIDAPQVIDAPLPIDAPLAIDARIIDASPLPIDAGPVGTVPTGGTCVMTSDCAVAGDCCVFGKATCQPGIEPIPGFCVPT